jgi:hypothetical protein
MKNSKLVEKYEKRHYWKKIGEIISMPPEKREEELNKWMSIFANDNPRFNSKVFKHAYEKALENPDIVPGKGEHAPLARRYNPDLPPVGTRKPSVHKKVVATPSQPLQPKKDLFSTEEGLYTEEEVIEIVKHAIKNQLLEVGEQPEQVEKPQVCPFVPGSTPEPTPNPEEGQPKVESKRRFFVRKQETSSIKNLLNDYKFIKPCSLFKEDDSIKEATFSTKNGTYHNFDKDPTDDSEEKSEESKETEEKEPTEEKNSPT